MTSRVVLLQLCYTQHLVCTAGEVERRMRASVRKQVMDSLTAYAGGGRKAWVTEWPAMVVLAVSAIFWSKEVEEAISGGLGRTE